MVPSFVPWHHDMIYAMLHGDRAMADSQLYRSKCYGLSSNKKNVEPQKKA